jgi:HK97 family phage major capsid protein
VKARKEARTGVRRILEADLWEISVVTFPMLPEARVTAVKAGRLPTAREFERWLVRDAGLTRSEAKAVIAGGFARFAAAGTARRKRTGPRGDDPRRGPATPTDTRKNETSRQLPPEEVKSAGEGDVAEAFDDFMHAFDEFKQANDERLVADREPLRRRRRDQRQGRPHQPGAGRAEAHARRAAARRPARRSAAANRLEPSEHKAAFEGYVRRGDERRLQALDAKAMSVGSGPDGGYLVPPETEAAIGARLRDISPIRSIAGVRQVSGSVLKKPFSIGGPAVGWVGETDARRRRRRPTLAELQFPTMELYAMPAATAALLEDGGRYRPVDRLGSGRRLRRAGGRGLRRRRRHQQAAGFLDYTQVAEASWSWGNLGYVATGVDGAWPASDPSDTLIDLVYALKAGYRQNAHWVMNRKTQAAIRKFKDADGNYIWQPPAAVGQRAMLMGFPLVEAEDMPDIASDATALAFGDFRRGYLVVDRTGVRCCAIPIPPSPTCCSTRPSASAAGCRISMPSSSSNSVHPDSRVAP